jgi:short-subunit dehydrogenase
VLVARNRDRLEQAAQSLDAQGFHAVCHTADVTQPADVAALRDVLAERFGRIHFLILNAGVVHVKLLAAYDNPHELKKDIETDLWGTVLPAHALVPLLSKGARVLLISSALGLVGVAGYSTYCAAKAGVLAFGEALRREVRNQEIAVYVACPTDIDTPQYRQEQREMPVWMRRHAGRSEVLSPEDAARKILAQCQGPRLLIFTSASGRLLDAGLRFLPHRLSDWLIDRIIPLP